MAAYRNDDRSAPYHPATNRRFGSIIDDFDDAVIQLDFDDAPGG